MTYAPTQGKCVHCGRDEEMLVAAPLAPLDADREKAAAWVDARISMLEQCNSADKSFMPDEMRAMDAYYTNENKAEIETLKAIRAALSSPRVGMPLTDDWIVKEADGYAAYFGEHPGKSPKGNPYHCFDRDGLLAFARDVRAYPVDVETLRQRIKNAKTLVESMSKTCHNSLSPCLHQLNEALSLLDQVGAS